MSYPGTRVGSFTNLFPSPAAVLCLCLFFALQLRKYQVLSEPLASHPHRRGHWHPRLGLHRSTALRPRRGEVWPQAHRGGQGRVEPAGPADCRRGQGQRSVRETERHGGALRWLAQNRTNTAQREQRERNSNHDYRPILATPIHHPNGPPPRRDPRPGSGKRCVRSVTRPEYHASHHARIMCNQRPHLLPTVISLHLSLSALLWRLSTAVAGR